jgi:TonB-linked SusC/RagA family outer membrane protein
MKKQHIIKGIASLLIAMTAQTAFAAGPGRTLKGRVVDSEGQPVVGAMVNLGEGLKMVLTDEEGNFELKKVDPTDEVFVDYLGYKQARKKADFSGNFEVKLELQDEYELLAPVAFSAKPKKLVTEATSVVTGSELEKHPITVLQNAFTATVAGVQTYEAQSEPGWSETEMYIRGVRTMNAAARAPLVIVDNVERDLSFLDAYPIESITVLKDAAATSIYGMRGANGVILVTTKRGEAGKLKINFTQEVGFQTNAGIPETQNSYNYALTYNQARYLDGLSPMYTDYDIEQYRKVCNGEPLQGMDRYHYFNTNWHETMLRDAAPMYRTNLQMSGGNDRARYYVSFSYLRQEGLFDKKWTEYNEDYSTQQVLNRFNLRVNVDLNINKFLTVGLDLGGRIDNILQPGIDIWNLFTWGAGENLPIYPVYCPNGEFFMPTANDSKNGAAQIAGRGIEQNRRRNLYTTVTATGDLGSLVKGLKAHAVVSFDAYETFQKVQRADINVFSYDFQNSNVTSPDQYTYQRMRTFKALPVATTSPREYYYNVNTRFGLSYNRRFGKHLVDAQAFLRTYQNVVRGQNSSWRNISWNAQATYAYNDRYIVSGNFSYMGSDNFDPENNWDTFGGVSVGWVASEEPFIKNLKLFDLLKVRASWGKAGMTTNSWQRYPYQSTFATGGGYNFGTSQSYTEGSYEATAGNPNNIWEVSKMWNLGIDFDLWHKKFYGQFDLFKEYRSQILVDRSTIPTLFGLAAPQDSYGEAETRGFELMLGHRNSIGKHFSYFVEGMLTWNRNKITEMDELTPDYAYQAKTGQRIGQYYMFELDQWASDPARIPTSHQDAIDHPEKYPYHAAGVYKLGNAVFKDANGDRIIDTYDQVPSGYSNTRIPELIPNIRIGFELYGFDARAIFTGYLNRTVECRENMDYGFGWGGTSTHEVTKTWGYYTDDPTDPRNINAEYPRLSTTFSDIDRNYPYNTSDIWLQSGNFWSLRNIEVGYSLPKKLIAKLYMSKCRVYFSAYNIKTWSHFENGFDPENPTNYIWAYPKTRSFSFGVNVAF